MQDFDQEGLWRLDKQMSDFFSLFWLASVLQNASAWRKTYATAPQGAGSLCNDVRRHRKNS